MQILDIIRAKQIDGVLTVSPDATVTELLALLAEHNIGAVVVSSDGAVIDGIVSERDVVRSLTRTADLLQRPVSEIMTGVVQACAPEDGLRQIAEQMTEHRVRHLPVVQDGQLIGIVSIGDVVKSRIDQLTFERDRLNEYVQQS